MCKVYTIWTVVDCKRWAMNEKVIYVERETFKFWLQMIMDDQDALNYVEASIVWFHDKQSFGTHLVKWWRHNRYTWHIIVLLWGFASQRECHVELWCFLWAETEEIVEQIMELYVIWDYWPSLYCWHNSDRFMQLLLLSYLIRAIRKHHRYLGRCASRDCCPLNDEVKWEALVSTRCLEEDAKYNGHRWE